VPEPAWRIHLGDGPLAAIAIHNGHEVREEVRARMAIDGPARLREEDPHTGRWTAFAPTRVVGLRSRFEVDFNRPRDKAVYRRPEDAWGMRVWSGRLPEGIAQRSLAQYDAFYRSLGELYGQLASRHRRFVVYDLHSYNHRRGGPGAPPADVQANPQVNVGTGTMTDRWQWASIVDRFIGDLSRCDFPGGRLDVRENVRFRGGHCARWTHETFPGAACVLSIELKKFFMDEWTGEADEVLVEAVGKALEATVPGVLEELGRLP
jgi:N-formylglutamate deformylase